MLIDKSWQIASRILALILKPANLSKKNQTVRCQGGSARFPMRRVEAVSARV